MNPPIDRRDRESVDEIRQRIHSLRQLVEDEVVTAKIEEDDDDGKNKKPSMDTGSLLSFTFGFILFLLIAVGIYAFRSLYYAILKRYSVTR